MASLVLYQEWINRVTITIVPPTRALTEGTSLITYHAISEPKTVSRGIIIPTSAAGIYRGAIVIKLNEASFSGAESLITSSYKSSVVVDARNTSPGTYQVTPAENIAASSSFLRATGNLSLSITV